MLRRTLFCAVACATHAPVVLSPASAASVLNPGLTGRLWFRPEDSPTYYIADARSGVKTPLVNRPSPKHYLVPSRDGRRFLFHTYDDTAERTKIDAGDLETRRRLGSVSVPGWVSAYRFSPDGRYVGLLRSPSHAENIDRRGLYIVDLADAGRPRVARDFLGSGDAFVLDFDWLPNGRYLYVRRDRRIFVGTPSGGESEFGIVQVPAGMRLAAHVAVHPEGNRMALVFSWNDGPLPKNDVWITRIDGSRPERVSTTGMNDDPQWSPDGEYLALKFDTGYACQAGGCFTTCHRWYVSGEARNVKDDQTRLRVYDRSKVTPEGLSCRRDVYWTQ